MACRNLLVAAFAAVFFSEIVRADVPVAEEPQTCVKLDESSFDSFIGDNDIALFQVYNGLEILVKELPEAISRLANPIAYATLDVSDAANAGLQEKVKLEVGTANQFLVFRHGLPHTSLKRLNAASTVDEVEEVLVFLSVETSSLEDAEAQQIGADGEPLPRWSIYHESRDKFDEVLSAKDFNAILDDAVSNQVTIVQFFSRYCKFCQLFSFEWHALAQTFEGKEQVRLVRVDGNHVDNAELLEKYGITGYPTVKFFLGSKYDSTFTGERKSDAVQDEVHALLDASRQSRRNSDGSFSVKNNMDSLLKNVERLYERGKLTEDEYVRRKDLLLKAGGRVVE